MVESDIEGDAYRAKSIGKKEKVVSLFCLQSIFSEINFDREEAREEERVVG